MLFALVGVLPSAVASDSAASLVYNSQVPAAVIARAEGGTRVVDVAGLIQVGQTQEVTKQDAWHLGSITKSMTATLVARLSEAGLIDRSATVGDVLGATFEVSPHYQNQTFDALLAHQSGLPPNLSRLQVFLNPAVNGPDGPQARQATARIALTTKPSPPGTYSNAGYIVAAAMLETATGRSWRDLIQEHVFQPFGLTSAGFGPPQTGPLGHRGGRPAGRDTDNVVALDPAGRVHMSPDDVLTYLLAHATRDPDLLSSDSWDWLHRPRGPDGLALGWLVRSDGSLWHNGSNTFWYAEVAAWPDGRAAFVAVNSGDIAKVQQAVGAALAFE